LFDGVYVVDEGGEARPLVEWTPKINDDALRLLIESLIGTRYPPVELHPEADDKREQLIAAFDADANGWPEVATLSKKDDLHAWRLSIKADVSQS
jgi:hypothetical protein